MHTFKEVLLSFLVLSISILYIVYQPEKTKPVLAVATIDTPQEKNKPLVTSKVIRVATSSLQKTSPTAPLQTTPSKSISKSTPPSSPKTNTIKQTPINPPKQNPVAVTKPAPSPITKPKGKYKDGAYKGSTINAYYGYVQVEPTIQAGKIVAVNFLRHPNNRQTSQYINAQAMPLLEKEAIQAQSAKVSGVSGATFTSEAFRKSLASALVQATNN